MTKEKLNYTPRYTTLLQTVQSEKMPDMSIKYLMEWLAMKGGSRVILHLKNYHQPIILFQREITPHFPFSSPKSYSFKTLPLNYDNTQTPSNITLTIKEITELLKNGSLDIFNSHFDNLYMRSLYADNPNFQEIIQTLDDIKKRIDTTFKIRPDYSLAITGEFYRKLSVELLDVAQEILELPDESIHTLCDQLLSYQKRLDYFDLSTAVYLLKNLHQNTP